MMIDAKTIGTIIMVIVIGYLIFKGIQTSNTEHGVGKKGNDSNNHTTSTSNTTNNNTNNTNNS